MSTMMTMIMKTIMKMIGMLRRHDNKVHRIREFNNHNNSQKI